MNAQPGWDEADQAIREAADAAAQHYGCNLSGGLLVLLDRIGYEDRALVVRVAREMATDLTRPTE